jgi:hypothetical protein
MRRPHMTAEKRKWWTLGAVCFDLFIEVAAVIAVAAGYGA